jgi:hypothetical protein
MKAMSLQPHQNEARAWRDEKIKQKGAKAGDLVSLSNPRMGAPVRLETNQVRPLLLTKKARPGLCRSAGTEGKTLLHFMERR